LLTRIPEACPVGAIGRLLWQRFTVDDVDIPAPGSSDWAKLHLFAGRSQGRTKGCILYPVVGPCIVAGTHAANVIIPTQYPRLAKACHSGCRSAIAGLC